MSLKHLNITRSFFSTNLKSLGHVRKFSFLVKKTMKIGFSLQSHITVIKSYARSLNLVQTVQNNFINRHQIGNNNSPNHNRLEVSQLGTLEKSLTRKANTNFALNLIVSLVWLPKVYSGKCIPNSTRHIKWSTQSISF